MVRRQVAGIGKVPEEHDWVAGLRYRPISLNCIEACSESDFTAGQAEGIFSCCRFETHIREHVGHASMLGGQLAVDPCRYVSESEAGRSGLNVERIHCSYRFVTIRNEEIHLKLVRQAEAGREGRQQEVLTYALRRNV